MAIYRFTTDGGVGAAFSEADLPDIHAAQVEAVRYLGELLADDGPLFWSDGEASLTVADDRGLTLFRLDLSAIQAASFPKSCGL